MEATFHDGTTIQVHDVIVLARKSQKRKGRVQTSIESQDEDARDWAEDVGLNVVATVPDTISGKKAMWDRPNAKPWVTQPEQMIRYQGIVASKMDRLTRADWQLEKELREWSERKHIALYLVEKDLHWPPRPGAHYNEDLENWNRESGDANREWNKDSRRWKRSHRQRAANNHLSGKAPFGYRIVGIDCGESPCRCYEREIDDAKQLKIYEPEARIVREVVTRYLAGESTEQIVKDYPRWVPSSLARFLRSPAIAGRRVTKEKKDKDGKVIEKSKTVLRYDGIIEWQTHEELVARLDSRAHRKGISPANSYLLTGVISCAAGHAMYGMTGGSGKLRYSCRYCRFGAPLELADDEVTKKVNGEFGGFPHMVKRTVPGANHFEQIAQLRADRNELDDLAPDYDEKHAAITAEIRRLTQLDKEHPEPSTVKWDFSGKSIEQHWASLSTAQRRDWLKENNWTVTATKLPDGRVQLDVDPNGTADRGWAEAAASLGWPSGVVTVRLFNEAMRKLNS